MKITNYQLENNSLTVLKETLPQGQWHEKATWVDIRTENRTEIVNYFIEHNVFTELRNSLEHPENENISKVVGDNAILNLTISDGSNIFSPNFITLIIAKKTLISILPENIKIIKDDIKIFEAGLDFDMFLGNFLYSLITQIMDQSRLNMGFARIKMHEMEKKIEKTPEKVTSADVMNLNRKISQLADIIEDQYVGYGILSSFKTAQHFVVHMEPLRELVKGFEPLNRTILRLEEKSESIRSYYMLLQQEKATRKINTLTIIQAVFVPLSFIAGVYGMNFLNMPELNWYYGYFIVLGGFALIAGALVFNFYKKGWFD